MKKALYTVLLCLLVMGALIAFSSCNEEVCQHRDADDNSLCDKCSKSYTDGTDVTSPKHTHEWGAWSITTPATCQAKGEETRNCACGEEETRDIEKDTTNHSAWGVWSVTTPATCQVKGRETRICACGHSETRDVAIDLTAHTFDRQVANNTYLKDPATTSTPARYFYSCACGAKGSESFPYGEALPIPVSSLTLNKSEITLYQGNQETLLATIAPTNASDKSVSWTTSNASVATVNNGIITAIGAGTATITVTTANGKTAVCEVTVSVLVSGVILDKTSIQLDVGETDTLLAIISPADATEKGVTWKTSDANIAIVNNGIVTAIGAGATTITATTKDGNFIASCVITVSVPVSGITLNKNSMVLMNGNSESLVATISPAHATNKNVSWSSSDTSVATVVNGRVTAVGVGVATITATAEDGNFIASCMITVTIPVSSVTLNKNTAILAKGNSETLIATILPTNASNKALRWESSDPAVATVENGIVSPLAIGTVTITVTTEDGGYTASCVVTVRQTADVKVYIDGAISQTLTTNNEMGYKITAPEKPADITTNPNAEKYFYAWFVDANFQTPLTEDTVFPDGGAIYAKWVDVYSNSFTYTVNYGKATITGFTNKTATVVVVPCYLNSFPVETIAANAFKDKTMIRTLIICEGIEVIKGQAFNNCNSLEKVVLPSSLTDIAENAFVNSPLISYTQAGNVQYLGNEKNPYLVAVCPTNSSVTEITIQRDCRFLMSTVYTKLNDLQSIFVEEGNANYSSQNGVLYNAPQTQILHVPAKLSGAIELPDGITTLASEQFANRSGITSITIPANVISIGSSAFKGCSGLKAVTFGSNSQLPHISSYTFYGCSDLTAITIPSSVTSIGSSAFGGCSSLESITLPFVGATLNSTSNTHFGYIFGASSYSYNNDYVPSSLKKVVITEGDAIAFRAFYDCNGITSITISSLVTSIGDSAFEGCNGLTSITLPFAGASSSANGYQSHFGYIFGYSSSASSSSSYHYYDTSTEEYFTYSIPTNLREVVLTDVTVINAYSFYGCSTITSVTLLSNITSIGSDAFYNCALTSFVLPSSVSAIGERAFYNCSELEAVIFEEQSQLTAIGADAFCNCALTSFVLPSGVSTIGERAFYNCSGLEAVIFEEQSQLTAIGADAFYNCNITSIVIPSSTTFIGGSAFYSCDELETVTFEEQSQLTSISNYAFAYCRNLMSITIPNSITSIGTSAFSGCGSLTSIEIPSSVASIGNSAFSGCNSLESITLPFVGATLDGTINMHFGYIFGVGTYLNYAANVPASLKTVVITGGTIIGEDAFSGCKCIVSVTIPSSVTSIGISAFKNCSGLASITLPSLVTIINDSAFYGCSGFTNITIPSSVTSIGASAFENCYGLTSITIPSGVTTIGENAFRSCGLSSITVELGNTVYHSNENCLIETATNILVLGGKNSVIPNYVTTIGASAFYGCTSLIGIEIPSSVTTIAPSAFEGCGLTSITIPSCVTSIGASAFYNCNSLVSVHVTDLALWCNISFDNSSANPLYYANNLYLDGVLVTDLTIPDGAATIGSYMFTNCKNLESITIPSSVTFIGSGAFSGCSSLTSVTIPSSVTSIGEDAFSGCSNIETVTFGENSELVTIGSGAFSSCSALTSIKIPSSVTSIGRFSFSGCDKMKAVIFSENSKLTTIGTYAFYCCSAINSVTLPSSIMTIGSFAFGGCNNLESITLPFVGASRDGKITHFGYIFGTDYYSNYAIYVPASLKMVVITGGDSIGDDAFSGCKSLTSITIPSSVTSIGSYAFSGCSSLKNITIPSSVTSIGASAFKNCSSLTSITILSLITSIDASVFEGCSSLSSIAIPSSVTSIGSYAFSGCSSLTSVTVPSSVTSIGNRAFYGCHSLESITLPFVGASQDGTIDTRFGYIFGINAYSSYAVNVPTTLKTVVITGGNSIGENAFSSCSGLTSIEIPSSVTRIGDSAFEYCSSLESIIIPSSVWIIGKYAFYDCSNLTSITIPLGVTTIQKATFEGCSGLKSITIPSSVTSINEYAFSGCSGLTSITIPDAVTFIGSNAFQKCSGLASVKFETTTGWQYSSNYYFGTTGTSISASSLFDASVAATYLTSTRCDYYWRRF